MSYSWTLNETSLGSLSSSTGNYTIFTAGSSAGAESLTVTATLDGITRNASAAITIVAPSPTVTTPLLAGLTLLEWGIIVVAVAVVVILLLVFIAIPRRRRSTEPAEAPEAGQFVPGGIAAESPTDYYSDVLEPPEIPEWSEDDAYGTYVVSPETVPGSPPVIPGIEPNRPFSMRISPEGITVEEIKRSAPEDAGAAPLPPEGAAPQPGAQKTDLGFNEIDVYAILSSLDRKPLALEGMKQVVSLDYQELTAAITLLMKAKLVTRTESKAGGILFALTPLGREMGHRFLSQGTPMPEGKGLEGTVMAPPREMISMEELHERAEETTSGAKVESASAQKIDPRLLQSIEMRVTGKDSEVHELTPEEEAKERERVLKEQERQKRKKRSKYGVMQEEKPENRTK
jgi:hypothetical protein